MNVMGLFRNDAMSRQINYKVDKADKVEVDKLINSKSYFSCITARSMRSFKIVIFYKLTRS